MQRMRAFSTAVFAAFAAVFLAQATASAQDATDRLSVPGPLSFDSKSYELAWSTNPQPNYYKQEYVQAGETPQTYSSMILLEVLTAGMDARGALAAQVQMLNNRKPNDPLVNMDVLQNEQTGEAILDFIVSSKDAQGEYIVEWSAYRYLPRQPEGVTLFGVSYRAYGNEASREFLSTLGQLRPGRINALAQHAVPDAQPAQQ